MKRTGVLPKKVNSKILKLQGQDGRRTEEGYNIALNGHVSRAPPWPRPQLQNEKMFILPKILASKDKIIVQGNTFYERRQLTIGLITGYNSPDHSNVACQISIYFNDPDKIAVEVIENGDTSIINENNAATDYFADPQYFEVQFKVRSEEILDVLVGESHLESVPLKHRVDDIRYLSVHGDVEKVLRLDFSFG